MHDEVFALYNGLSEEEVIEKLAKYGPNELERKGRVTILGLAAGQFSNAIIIILIAAATVSFFVGETLNATAILVAILLSVSLGTIQEYRGEQAMEALVKMTALKARVIRNGVELVVETRDLVPGDIIIVSEGDKVPADAEVLSSTGLLVDESVLTGESVTVEKDSSLSGEGKRLYMGTAISRGKGTCVVKGTGMATEMGRIVKTLQVREEKTPLQKKLEELAGKTGMAGIIACVLVFFIGKFMYANMGWNEMFLIAVTLAVASVPEGLATTVTITLAIGMRRMASRNAIVRKLLAVESLGSVTVICTDKTGTITQNRMTVRKVYAGGQRIDVTGEGYEPRGRLLLNGEPVKKTGRALDLLIRCATACNSSTVSRRNGVSEAIGDPTEVSLLVLAEKAGFRQAEFRKALVCEGEPLFDSKKRLMVSVNRDEGSRFAYVKGAFESVIERSDRIAGERGESKLTSEDRRRLAMENEMMAESGLRVIALAYRKLGARSGQGEGERGLVFLGLAGMIDPPRDEVFEAVRDCERAGIRVVMITGDNPITARAIASEVGIFKDGDRILTGSELSALSDRDLNALSDSVSVYARILPEQKLRIVGSLQARGNIVSMTGDGVNDVPSIKKADVGVSMGSGTDVAKESSEVILADDNFATIVRAVKYGRTIYDNIRNFVRFQFSTNVAAVATMFIAPFTQLPLPFTPLGLLWINIIMDGPPALALGLEPPGNNLMNRKPRNPNESIISGLLFGVFMTGAVMCAGTLALLAIGGNRDPAEAATLAFTGFVVFQLFNALNCRSDSESFVSGFFRNGYLILALLASATLQLMIVYLPPLQHVFKTTPLELDDWLVIIAVASSVIVVEEVRKFVDRRRKHAKHQKM